MDVFAFDPFLKAEDISAAGVTPLDSAEKLYSSCEYISLHIPSNDKTKQSINYDLLKTLPTFGTLVNTARKEVVHEDELLKLMAERNDIFYISDIAPDKRAEFEEKYDDRVFFTPKKNGSSDS